MQFRRCKLEQKRIPRRKNSQHSVVRCPLEPPSRACIDEVKKFQFRHLYIGRGATLEQGNGRTSQGGRKQAITQYESYFRLKEEMLERIPQSQDKVLVCHCRVDEACHADVLIKLFDEHFANVSNNGEEPPPAEELFEAAKNREVVEDPETDTEPDEDAAPCGSGWVGKRPHMQVGQGLKARRLRDGAGLCSPGRWP